MPKNPKTITLHIGAHKTASSLLSRLLHKCEADSIVSKDFTIYQRSLLMESPFFQALLTTASGRGKAVPEFTPALAEEFDRMLDVPTPNVLFVSEDMFTRIRMDRFYHRIGRALSKLKQLRPDCTFRVILYVREQVSYVESCYTQMLHLGRNMSFSEFIDNTVPLHLSWLRVAAEIEMNIGRENTIIKAYETIKDMGVREFFLDYLRAVGVNAPEALVFDEESMGGAQSNRSYSDIAVKMAAIAAPVITQKDARLLRTFLQTHFSNDKYPRPTYLPKEWIAAMRGAYAESNAQLFKQYLPHLDPVKLGYT